MVILILPMIEGAYAFTESGKLSCAKDAVPLIVEKIMAGIVNHACKYEYLACERVLSHL